MSESHPPAPLPDSDDEDERRQNGRRIEDRHKIERNAVRSLLAMLLGSIGIVLAVGVLWLQLRLDKQLHAVQPRQSQIQKDIEVLRARLAASDARWQANANRLEPLESLPPRIAGLTDAVGRLNTRMEASQRPWIAAEARYLIDIANRRLSLDRDRTSALAALESAEELLQTLRDPGLNGVKRTLAAEIQSLHAVRQPDLSGIALQLATAEQRAGTLPVLGAIADRYRPENTEEGSAPGFARAWQLLRSSLTNMISVRRIGKDAVELVSLEEQSVRRQHLQLLLSFARAAAVRGDQTLFHASIVGAREWLVRMFDPRDAAVAALGGELQRLAATDIEPALPDISGSMKMLERLAPAIGEVRP